MSKRHKLKTWSNTGPYRKAHTVTIIETKGESLIEVINASGFKSRVTREKARAMWKEYVDIGWKVAK